MPARLFLFGWHHQLDLCGKVRPTRPTCDALLIFTRYALMDILLAHILQRFRELEERGCSYDVFCIYIRNLLSRFEKDYPDLVDLVDRARLVKEAEPVLGLPCAAGNPHVVGIHFSRQRMGRCVIFVSCFFVRVRLIH